MKAGNNPGADSTTAAQYNAKSPHILIIGAGPVGSLTAGLLAGAGYKVTVCERRQQHSGHTIDPYPFSWPMALSQAGMENLQVGGVTLQAPSAFPFESSGIVRGATVRYRKSPAQQLLTSRAAIAPAVTARVVSDYPSITWLFQHSFQSFSPDDANVAVLEDCSGETGQQVSIPFDLIIGADGARSRVREAVQKLDKKFLVTYKPFADILIKSFVLRVGDLPRYVLEQFLVQGGKVATLAEVQSLTQEELENKCRPLVRKQILRLGRVLMGPAASPHSSTEVSPKYDINGVLAMYPRAWDSSPTPEQLTLVVERELMLSKCPPTLQPQLSATAAAIVATMTPPRARSIATSTWCSHLASGSCVLVGDAAHAMCPFLGQGVNSGLEDAVLLSLFLTGKVSTDITIPSGVRARFHLRNAMNNLPKVLPAAELPTAAAAFSRVRGPEVRAITSMSHIQGRVRSLSLNMQLDQYVFAIWLKARAWLPTFVPPPVFQQIQGGQVAYSDVLYSQIVVHVVLASTIVAFVAIIVGVGVQTVAALGAT